MKIREGEIIPSTEFFYIDASGAVKKLKALIFLLNKKQSSLVFLEHSLKFVQLNIYQDT